MIKFGIQLSLVEHLLWEQGVVGSNPTIPIVFHLEADSYKFWEIKIKTLLLKLNGRPNQIYRAGVNNSYLSDFALANCRTPSGHPEGFIEAFANIYRNFSYSDKNYKNNKKDDLIYDYPTVEEGYRGMRFIDAVIDSSKNSKWIKI